MPRVTWTKEEDDVLRRAYRKIIGRTTQERVWQKILEQLPRRSKASCLVRASKLRIANKARWSEAEDKIIRDWFADGSARGLKKLLPRRSWEAIKGRAKRLGVNVLRWQGYVSVTEAAARLNFSLSYFTNILKAMGVALRNRADAGGKRARYRHHVVEWEEAEDAVKRWLTLDTTRAAAARWGLKRDRVQRWVREARGYQEKPGVALRLPAAEFDKIIKERLEKGKRPEDGEQLSAVERAGREPDRRGDRVDQGRTYLVSYRGGGEGPELQVSRVV